MLYLISLGIHDEKDMSLKALETAKACDRLYLELYTTGMKTTAKALSKLIGKPVKEIPREGMENQSSNLIQEAKEKDVGVLVGGDALSATTHISLFLEARKAGVKTKIIHGSSIVTAVAETGLSLYKFGRTVTLTDPPQKSTLDGIKQNQTCGLHTLILLDIGMKPSRALELLKGRVPDKVLVASGLGGKPAIKYGTLEGLLKKNLSDTPAVLVIPGELHFLEKEYLESL